MKKLIVKCTCGKAVTLTKSDAARIMAAGNKTKLSAVQRKERATYAAQTRWKNQLDSTTKL